MRPVTLFTGQWVDLTLEEVARHAAEWGYDGLEIACWGDHLDPWQAAEDDAYFDDDYLIPYARSLFLGFIYTFTALPDTPMAPRLSDGRVGYFSAPRVTSRSAGSWPSGTKGRSGGTSLRVASAITVSR